MLYFEAYTDLLSNIGSIFDLLAISLTALKCCAIVY